MHIDQKVWEEYIKELIDPRDSIVRTIADALFMYISNETGNASNVDNDYWSGVGYVARDMSDAAKYSPSISDALIREYGSVESAVGKIKENLGEAIEQLQEYTNVKNFLQEQICILSNDPSAKNLFLLVLSINNRFINPEFPDYHLSGILTNALYQFTFLLSDQKIGLHPMHGLKNSEKQREWQRALG